MTDTNKIKSSIHFLKECLELTSLSNNFKISFFNKEFYQKHIETITVLWLKGILREKKYTHHLGMKLNENKEIVERFRKYTEIELNKLEAMLIKNN